jgi:hypothetical protein
MSTYAEVISANPSYSARRYTRRLPYAIIAPAIGGLAIILLFFFAPWFSTGEPATLASAASLKGPVDVSALTLGTNTVNFTQLITNNDGSASHNVSDSYSFPLIWAIPVVGLIQIVLALLVLKERVLTRVLGLAIRLSFLAAVVFELIFFVSSYFLAFVHIKDANGQIATFPVSGFWLSLLITVVTTTMALVVMPDLKWCWTLSVNDMVREVRMSELRASNANAG